MNIQKLGIIKLYPNKLLAIVFLHFIVFSTVGVSRHWGYMTSINDLGSFDQAIWGIIHKGFMLNSFGHAQSINWLGHHFNPILYLFAPFYYVLPTVNWLIFAQSAALSLAALPIFLLAKQIIQSEDLAMWWSIVYLVNPFVLSADVWDFHPVSLAVPFIALAFLAIEQKKAFLFAIANITLLLCQEQFGLTVASFGLLYGIKNRELRISSTFLVLGIIFFILILGVVIPGLSPSQQHYMFGETGNPDANRYGWLGHSPKETVKTLLFSPWNVVKKIVFEFKGLSYLNSLLTPVLYTALAAPLFMLPMGGDLLANILSSVPMPRDVFSYHSVTIVPVLTVAAIYGCNRISGYFSVLSFPVLTRFVCCCAFTFGYLLAPLPLPFARNVWQPNQTIAQYDDREDEIKALVVNHSISVQNNIGAHFSQREKIYRFPDKLAESDYVIFWLSYPARDDYFSPAYDPGFIHHIQLAPNDYLTAIEKLLQDKRFKIAYWNDPWLVFKQESNPHRSEKSQWEQQVLEKIKSLRKKLQTPFTSVR